MNPPSKSINEQDVRGIIERLLKPASPTVCRHKVVLDLLSALEENMRPPEQVSEEFKELASAVVDADDERALAALSAYFVPQS